MKTNKLNQKNAPHAEIKNMRKLINKLKKTQQALHNTILKQNENDTDNK